MQLFSSVALEYIFPSIFILARIGQEVSHIHRLASALIRRSDFQTI